MGRSRQAPIILPPAPTLEFEAALWAQGIYRIAGLDEAGRGPLAGPVCAAAVILPADPAVAWALEGVRDSKQMTAAEREHWAGCIRQVALSTGVAFATHQEIDTLGIAPATRLAMSRALEGLASEADHLLIDYVRLLECPRPQTSLVKGDARCLSIAAASVLAKTARDAVMLQLEAQYPGYGFAAHKGYATPEHLAALERLGPCAIHRRSFAPLKALRFE